MASTKNNEDRDKFVDLVTATAEVTLPLGEFHPKSMLATAEHHIERARFPVIDYHNHLDSVEPEDALRVMDACGVEKIVNITMKTGDAALRMIDKFAAGRPAALRHHRLDGLVRPSPSPASSSAPAPGWSGSPSAALSASSSGRTWA